MQKTFRCWGLFFLLVTASANAQDLDYYDRPRERTIAAGTGVGFMLDPSAFLLALEGDYFFTHHVAVGPLFQFGIRDDGFLMFPSVNIKGVMDLPPAGFWKRVKPYAQAGLGLAYANLDVPGDNDQFDFAFHFGAGADTYLNTNLSFGTSMLFNIIPGELFGDRFSFSWQVVTVRYHF